MPPPRGQQVLEEEPTICAKCELTFKTFMDYHKHKMHSRRHITCEVCSQDFESHEACKQHHDLMHPQEQDMNCPGCGKHFIRLGSLMSHIELTECDFFRKENIEKSRKMKMEWYANSTNARNFRDYGRTAGDFSNAAPNPLNTPAPPKLVCGPNGVMLVAANGEPVQEPVPRPLSPTSAVVFNDDNLLSFDEIGLTTAPPTHLVLPRLSSAQVLKQDDFPSLTTRPINITNTPAVESQPRIVWAAKQKLFTDAPPAIAPPVDLLKSINVEDEQEEDEDPTNPDSKGFKAKKFYIDLIGKYRCPHRGCGKSIESSAAFIQHLKSPAHHNEKLQCINCLRYFATATALTQHCEAQGVRCKVRQTSEYDAVIDGITGGTAITAGRHIDDTIKYAVNPAVLALGASSVVEAHKNRQAENDKKFNGYWNDKIAKW